MGNTADSFLKLAKFNEVHKGLYPVSVFKNLPLGLVASFPQQAGLPDDTASIQSHRGIESRKRRGQEPIPIMFTATIGTINP